MVYDGGIMPRRIALLLSSSFLLALAVGAGATGCAEDGGYVCTVVWSDMDGMELGTKDYEYPDIGSAQVAADTCAEDQEDDSDRPDGATGHACSCFSS